MIFGLTSGHLNNIPLRCCTCDENCENRADSWRHTERTGHQRFESLVGLPCFNGRAEAGRAETPTSRHQSKHCQHCKGLRDACVCKSGCPRIR
eukprot:3644803-Amphidinium_carterae.1